MKKIIVLFVMLTTIFCLFGCNSYDAERGIEIADNAINATLKQDFIVEMTYDAYSLQKGDPNVLSTNKFDKLSTSITVFYDADNGKFKQIKTVGDEVIEDVFVSINDSENILGAIMLSCNNVTLQDVKNVTAVSRINKQIVRLYCEDICVIDETLPFLKNETGKQEDERLDWNNISKMDTFSYQLTINHDRLNMLEYYVENVEQKNNPLGLIGESIVGIVVSKIDSTITFNYENVEI